MMPGRGRLAPPGASATTEPTLGSWSGVASAVQPPKLCPTTPTRVPSNRSSPAAAGSSVSTSRTSGTRRATTSLWSRAATA